MESEYVDIKTYDELRCNKRTIIRVVDVYTDRPPYDTEIKFEANIIHIDETDIERIKSAMNSLGIENYEVDIYDKGNEKKFVSPALEKLRKEAKQIEADIEKKKNEEFAKQLAEINALPKILGEWEIGDNAILKVERTKACMEYNRLRVRVNTRLYIKDEKEPHDIYARGYISSTGISVAQFVMGFGHLVTIDGIKMSELYYGEDKKKVKAALLVLVKASIEEKLFNDKYNNVDCSYY